MAVTINLTPEEEAKLKAHAQAQGPTVEEWLVCLIAEDPAKNNLRLQRLLLTLRTCFATLLLREPTSTWTVPKTILVQLTLNKWVTNWNCTSPFSACGRCASWPRNL